MPHLPYSVKQRRIIAASRMGDPDAVGIGMRGQQEVEGFHVVMYNCPVQHRVVGVLRTDDIVDIRSSVNQHLRVLILLVDQRVIKRNAPESIERFLVRIHAAFDQVAHNAA